MRTAFVLLAVVAALFLGAYAWIHHDGNIHVVEAGQFYRSQQLNSNQLAAVIDKYRIRSILNLRGTNPGTPWYSREIAVSQSMEVAHVDYALSARQRVSAEQIDEILDLIKTAPKPILVHCQAGADRTGLISAIYLLEVAGKDANEADQQLSLRYGHFPYLTSKTSAMDDSFWSYAKEHEHLNSH